LLPGQTTSTQDKPSGGQSPSAATAAPPSDTPDVNPDDLPEEDDSLKPKVYPFNPLESERNIKVGEFYMRQGNARGYRAAAGRFDDATKYNPSSAEAFFKLGEAQQKLKHNDKAKAAFEKAEKLASPDSKIARDARKKLASLS
jgi:tetratricopeptide (TPR) repeat protein